MSVPNSELLLLFNGPATAPTTVILAHGAGAGMDTPFMEFFAQRLAEGGLRVVRFEFPYMAQRRLGGPKRPPDREDVLRQDLAGCHTPVSRESVGDRRKVTGRADCQHDCRRDASVGPRLPRLPFSSGRETCPDPRRTLAVDQDAYVDSPRNARSVRHERRGCRLPARRRYPPALVRGRRA